MQGMVVGRNRLKCSRMRIGQGTARCAKYDAHFEVFKSFGRYQQECITERFKELLTSGVDELMVQLISVKQAESELNQLMQLIGRL
jgi:hypothetical protein